MTRTGFTKRDARATFRFSYTGLRNRQFSFNFWRKSRYFWAKKLISKI